MSDRDQLIKVYEYALNQEKTGMNFFQDSLARLSYGAAVTAFKQLIDQEKMHIEFISRIIHDLKNTGDIDVGHVQNVTLASADFFDQRAQSELLEQCIVESMIPDVTVFNLAWLIEKDLSEFYANAAAQTEGLAHSAFGMLSEWEKGHERFFKLFRDRLTDMYSRMPWGG